MPGLDLIQDLAILLLTAACAGVVCQRLGLSVIVGYLVAGIIIGPHTPPFSLVSDAGRIETLSQLGLVFLMFGIGLGLSLTKFARLGAAPLIATGLGAAAVLVVTEFIGALAGWTPRQAMFVAAMLMVSSSAVIAKVIAEQTLSHERSSRTALAVTVLEDVVAVAMLTLLASQASVAPDGPTGLGALLGGLGGFVVLLVGTGLLLVPRVLRRLDGQADSEMLTLVAAGLLFALALAAARAGYSIALGAFLFGAIVAELPRHPEIEISFRGLRDVFSSVFFVSIGMMIDPRLLLEVWPWVLGLSAFALIIRPVACGLALVLVGTAPAEARRASLLLTPLGEFSFIIAQLGISTTVLPATFYPVAVGASILTVLATPTLARHREPILRFIARMEPRGIGRALDAYHAWLTELRARPSRTPVWNFLRPRLWQVALEMLFISGLLSFSESVLSALSGAPWLKELDPTTMAYVAWSLIAGLVLIPLFAVWRNCSALALLLAEAWESPSLPRRILERMFKASVALALTSWIYLILPQAPFAPWGWLAIAAAASVVAALFSRRLIYWHSQWLSAVRDVLAGRGLQNPSEP